MSDIKINIVRDGNPEQIPLHEFVNLLRVKKKAQNQVKRSQVKIVERKCSAGCTCEICFAKVMERLQ